MDHEMFKPHSDKVWEHVRGKFFINRRFILSVGGSKPHKNAKATLGAFELLSQKEDLDLVFAGKINENKPNEDIRKLISDKPRLKDRVHFLGYVEDLDLVHLYRSAEMLAFPSFYEGFGIPPLEAMGCGCPVIVSNAASLPEICGDAALYVDPHSCEELASAMQKILHDPVLRRIQVEKGLKVVESFQWKKSAHEHLRVIEGMI